MNTPGDDVEAIQSLSSGIALQSAVPEMKTNLPKFVARPPSSGSASIVPFSFSVAPKPRLNLGRPTKDKDTDNLGESLQHDLSKGRTSGGGEAEKKDSQTGR